MRSISFWGLISTEIKWNKWQQQPAGLLSIRFQSFAIKSLFRVESSVHFLLISCMPKACFLRFIAWTSAFILNFLAVDVFVWRLAFCVIYAWCCHTHTQTIYITLSIFIARSTHTHTKAHHVPNARISTHRTVSKMLICRACCCVLGSTTNSKNHYKRVDTAYVHDSVICAVRIAMCASGF